MSRACNHCLREICGLRLKIGSSAGTSLQKKRALLPSTYLWLRQDKRQESIDLRRGQNQYFLPRDQPFSKDRQKRSTIRKYPFESRTCEGLAIIASHRAYNPRRMSHSNTLPDEDTPYPMKVFDTTGHSYRAESA